MMCLLDRPAYAAVACGDCAAGPDSFPGTQRILGYLDFEWEHLPIIFVDDVTFVRYYNRE